MADLRCEGLSFRYGRHAPELFGGLTHRFRAGAVTVVSGVSGRGKSTLLYVLGLMLRPTSGRVCDGDNVVSGLNDAARARYRGRGVGFVFQDAALDPARRVIDSIVEPGVYAGMTRRAAIARGRELAAQLGVNARLDHRPGAISGGEAQRVALCRALLVDPRVLLADEPTGNLERGNTEAVVEVLRGAADEGKTVVIATHDPALAAVGDETVAL
ncbi:MAG: ATP-binding cassette domain-containing protein [Bifidobacteriaceae bacterium]|jgi:putative ABC transport system ATP-binding protein/lipoprotein-releasing system ATP-binding protein|nr:ATP-binding cassette domain-containing protein [Bifidobacteriaceae bacterium]